MSKCYTCPVCLCDKLKEPPMDFLICPMCGTEFGFDDYVEFPNLQEAKWFELRELWIKAGKPIFDPEGLLNG